MSGKEPRLKISPNAFELLYGRALVCIVSASLIEQTVQRFEEVWSGGQEPEPILLCLHEDGALCCPGEHQELAEFEPQGAPAGLSGVVIAQDDPRVDWLIFALFVRDADQAPPRSYRIHRNDKTAIDRVIGRLFSESASRFVAQLSDQEGLIVSQRLEIERQAGLITRLQNQLESIGESSYLAVSVEPGSETLDLSNEIFGGHIVHRMPVTAEGLHSISLCIAQPAKGPTALRLTLVEPYSGLVLSERVIDAPMHVGWNEIVFTIVPELAATQSEVDLILTVEGESAGPIFRASASAPDRFGILGHDTALALRVHKILDNHSLAAPLVRSHSGSVELLGVSDAVSFAGTPQELEQASQALGANPLSQNAVEQYIQTHPFLDDQTERNLISGAAIEGALSPAMSGYSAVVALDHPQAAPLSVATVACPASTPPSQYQSLLKAALSDDLPPTCRGARGELVADSTCRLDVDLTGTDQPCTIMLVGALPKEGRIDYGFCRWSRIIRRVGPVVTKMTTQKSVWSPPVAPKSRNIPLSGWDLAAQSTFIEGQEEQQRLERALGYPILEILRERSTLQIHPILDQTSAVLCRNMVPAEALSFQTKIETAHASAPDFVYGALILPSDNARHAERLAMVVDNLPRAVGVGVGGTLDDGTVWQALVGEAKQPRKMTLVFDTADHPRDLILFALPAEESVSFGWCQFTDMSVKIQDGLDETKP